MLRKACLFILARVGAGVVTAGRGEKLVLGTFNKSATFAVMIGDPQTAAFAGFGKPG